MFRIEAEKLLVGFVLAFIVAVDMLGTTMLGRLLPSIPSSISVLVSLCLLIRFKDIKKFSINYLVFAPLLLIVGFLVALQMKNYSFLAYMILLVSLYDMDMDFILKVYSAVVGPFILGTVLLSLVHVIPNLQFIQMRNTGVVTRNSFGFIYPTDFASHCFYLYVALSYLNRNRFLITRSVLGLGLAAFIIKFCDARLNTISIIISVLIFAFFYFNGNKHYKFFGVLPVSILASSGIMYYLTKNFTWSSPFYVAANDFVSMRLRLGNDALKTYAVRLFGNPEVKFIGYGGKTESVLSYNYVDSSYIQMLFYYGSATVILLVVLYLVRSWVIYRQGNYLILTLLSLITWNCMIEAFWIRPSYNIFFYILFASTTLEIARKNRRV
ncbi:polysaccharide polymerase [Streptococcus alactolyticus]|uniref:polysaccharide polymerase n=1 Tax=Streptococcus alactolyticus TaxID=29389 RepID=UPI003519271D